MKNQRVIQKPVEKAEVTYSEKNLAINSMLRDSIANKKSPEEVTQKYADLKQLKIKNPA